MTHYVSVCAVTGLCAGDPDACGDCDPCLESWTQPKAVLRLIREKEAWRQKYAECAAALDEMQNAPDPLGEALNSGDGGYRP